MKDNKIGRSKQFKCTAVEWVNDLKPQLKQSSISKYKNTISLKWDAINFNACTITIKRTIVSTMIDGKREIFKQDSTKTKANYRTLPLV